MLLNEESHRGQTHLKMTTRARAIQLQQPLQCKSQIQAPTGALGIRLLIRLVKIRFNSPNPDLLCTQVMQLYDGLSINKMKHLSVKVKELTPSVKLVKLEPNQSPAGNIWNKFTSLFTRANPETAKGFQVKMVDMGGHTATPLKAFHSVHFSKLDQS